MIISGRYYDVTIIFFFLSGRYYDPTEIYKNILTMLFSFSGRLAKKPSTTSTWSRSSFDLCYLLSWWWQWWCDDDHHNHHGEEYHDQKNYNYNDNHMYSCWRCWVSQTTSYKFDVTFIIIEIMMVKMMTISWTKKW